MKNAVYTLSIIVLALGLTACGSGGGSGSTSADVAPIDPINAIPSDLLLAPLDPSAPVDATASLTYYARSKTTSPINGWVTKTVTTTAYCVEYQTKTYCWDDGVKTLTWKSGNYTYGPFTYTYFGLQGTAQNYSHCFGGCGSDLMPLPRVISATLQNAIGAAIINDVFTNGTPHAVNCTESQGQLNCIDFVINLNQAPL